MYVKEVFVLFAIFGWINTASIVGNPSKSVASEGDYDPQAIANRIRALNPEEQQNAWMYSGHFEGDIQEGPIEIGNRNGLIDTDSRWPYGIVPFYLQPNGFTRSEQQTIDDALMEIGRRTCIRFIRYNKFKPTGNYVHVVPGVGCSSYVGNLKMGGQNLTLQRDGCIYHRTIIHEFMHALGFVHEQSAPDRDNYVNIHEENIKPDDAYNFNKYSNMTVTNFGYGYDYGSIMHYGEDFFGKNGLKTITAKNPHVTMGQARNMSRTDVLRVNEMYAEECAKRNAPRTSTGRPCSTATDCWNR